MVELYLHPNAPSLLLNQLNKGQFLPLLGVYFTINLVDPPVRFDLCIMYKKQKSKAIPVIGRGGRPLEL
jgi:hypothetical protein